ncbi:hypothetical protein ACFSTE_02920 [Aquimarina hainanensis]|uniref:Phage tail protein n=1 Tax=Aquimarina hainanensis TaxID=1578017 RepID=A0ABW5N3S1_9FLAO
MINTGRSFHDDNEISEYRYEVSNKGTGPAIIEGVKITYKGEIARNWKELYTALEVPDTIRKGHTNEMISNRVISSGGSILLIDFSNNKKVMKWVFEKAKDIHITICYKSVFGEFWEIKREGFYTNLEATKRTSVVENTIREEERFIE